MLTATYQINIPIPTTCSNYQISLINDFASKNFTFPDTPINYLSDYSGWQHTVMQPNAFTLKGDSSTLYPIFSPYYSFTKIKELVVLENKVPEFILNNDIIPNLFFSILKEINTIVPLRGNSSVYFYKDYEDPNFQQLVLKISVNGSTRGERNAYLQKACNKLDEIIKIFKATSLPEHKTIIDNFYYFFSIKFIS